MSACAVRNWNGVRAQVGTKLRGFGASLLSGTTGLLEKVHDTISAELEGMEDQLVGRGRAAHAGAARCGESPAVGPCVCLPSCWGKLGCTNFVGVLKAWSSSLIAAAALAHPAALHGAALTG